VFHGTHIQAKGILWAWTQMILIRWEGWKIINLFPDFLFQIPGSRGCCCSSF